MRVRVLYEYIDTCHKLLHVYAKISWRVLHVEQEGFIHSRTTEFIIIIIINIIINIIIINIIRMIYVIYMMPRYTTSIITLHDLVLIFCQHMHSTHPAHAANYDVWETIIRQ